MIWSWVNIIKALIGFANYVAEIIRDKRLLDAGEAQHLAKDIALLQKRLGISDQVVAEVSLLTDQEIDDELRT